MCGPVITTISISLWDISMQRTKRAGCAVKSIAQYPNAVELKKSGSGDCCLSGRPRQWVWTVGSTKIYKNVTQCTRPVGGDSRFALGVGMEGGFNIFIH